MDETRHDPAEFGPADGTRNDPIDPADRTRHDPLSPGGPTRNDPLGPGGETRHAPFRPAGETRDDSAGFGPSDDTWPFADRPRSRAPGDETYRDTAAAPGPGIPAQPPRAATTVPGGDPHSPEVTLRFGPGIPEDVARAWRSGGRPRRRLTRRLGGVFLTVAVAVLAAVAVWWFLRGSGPSVEVTGVTVKAPAGVQRCDATVTVMGTIRTNGGRGEVAYRWRRSDGEVSGVFTETVRKGQHSLHVPLRWTVKGTGTLHAVATLEVVRPRTGAGSASGAFDYRCG